MAFSFSRSLTIDHTKCGASDSSSFPVLVSGSDATLKSIANGGHVQDAGGADILFFSDSLLTTQVASEIEFYDPVNGVLVAWVKVGTVSHTVDTVTYIAYGNAAPPARTATPWDTNYRMVQHLPNGTSLTANDSTGNGNNSSAISATPATGKIDGGAAFNATTQVITIPNSASLNFTGAITIEAWFFETSSAAARAITDKGPDFVRSMTLLLETGSLNIVRYNNVGQLILSRSWTLNTWHHLVLTDDGTNIKVYLDGASAYSNTGGTGAAGNTSTLNIGYALADANSPFSGSLDEIRISASVRTADWILTEYNNQNAPGNIGTPGFLTWGPEVPISSGGGSLLLLGCG